MSFHPAVFNVTVHDPSLYHGLQGAQHPFFQQAGRQQVSGVPTGVPTGVPSQYLDLAQDDSHFQHFVNSLPSELQGPVAFRNSSSNSSRFPPGPVKPRLTIPTISNSTFVQLPVSTHLSFVSQFLLCLSRC